MDQFDILKLVTRTLESMSVRYMVGGSYASGAWGETRFTQDIDVVLDLRLEDVERFVGAFSEEEFYVSVEAAKSAVRQRGQFNLIHGASGNKVDFILVKDTAWARSQLDRRRRIALPSGLMVYVCAPEDIIISKMAYYRQGGIDKHLRDITGIMKVSGDQVDTAYVERWAKELDLMEIWEAILRRLSSRSHESV